MPEVPPATGSWMQRHTFLCAPAPGSVSTICSFLQNPEVFHTAESTASARLLQKALTAVDPNYKYPASVWYIPDDVQKNEIEMYIFPSLKTLVYK